MTKHRVNTPSGFKQIVGEVFQAREWTPPQIEEQRTGVGRRWYKALRVKIWQSQEMNIFIDYHLGDVYCFFSGKDALHRQRTVWIADLRSMAQALAAAAEIVETYYERLHEEKTKIERVERVERVAE